VKRCPPRLAKAAIVASALLLAGGAFAIVVTAFLGAGNPGRRSTQVFPGGSRILFADARGLKWMYPDEETIEIAPSFIGANLVAGGNELLAARPTENPEASPPCGGCFADVDYYLMNLDGSERRLILQAETTTGGTRVGHLDVQMSPDGTRLAYVRQLESGPATIPPGELWVVDLATDRRTELGSAPSSDLPSCGGTIPTCSRSLPTARSSNW
jgi:hypothetical protein